MASTIEAIRDRQIALVTAITPAIVSGVPFRHSQDEGDGDFREVAESAPAAAFRRFQITDNGEEEVPDVTAGDETLVTTTFEITVAYPHSKIAGQYGARDRFDCIDSDWRKIDYVIGCVGRGNFSSTNDCTPGPAEMRIDEGESCDFMVITLPTTYYTDVVA